MENFHFSRVHISQCPKVSLDDFDKGSSGLHSGHMKSKQRRTDIEATSLNRIDVSTTSLRRQAPTGALHILNNK